MPSPILAYRLHMAATPPHSRASTTLQAPLCPCQMRVCYVGQYRFDPDGPLLEPLWQTTTCRRSTALAEDLHTGLRACRASKTRVPDVRAGT
jgi:hypothetical protein